MSTPKRLTYLVVHGSSYALREFKTDVLPRLLQKDIKVVSEEPTIVCLREENEGTGLLTEISHGVSLLKPALSFYLNLQRGPNDEQLWYLRDGEMLAYKQLGGDPTKKQYGPVVLLEAAFQHFSAHLT